MRQALSLKTILIGIAVVAVSFLISLKAMDWIAPRGGGPAPALVELPPLPPVSKRSFVLAPVAIALTAIRDAADRAAPRNFGGKADNPISQILQNADIGWTARRARADRGDRRPGRAVAGDAADRQTQRHGLAVVEGDRRGRRRARRAVGRQSRQEDRQREHQVAQRQRRDQGQRHLHVAAEARRHLAPRAESGRAGDARRHQPFGGRRPRQTCRRR